MPELTMAFLTPIASENNPHNDHTTDQDKTKKALGNTLLDNDPHMQEAYLRSEIQKAERHRDTLKDTIDTFAREYNRNFTNEIAELSVLKAEHKALLVKIEEREHIAQGHFIGAGSMWWDNSYTDAPTRDFENLSEDEQKEIRDVYKFLAKKLHPSAHEGASDEERQGFANIFKMVSDAYDKWDLASLKVLAEGFNWSAFQKSTEKEEKNTTSKNKINILDALWIVLKEVQQEILTLECSKAYQNYTMTLTNGEQWWSEEKWKFDHDIKEYTLQIEALRAILDDPKKDQ